MSISEASTPIEPLSERELQILGLMTGGLSNQEIADRLYLSLNTIKWHNKQIFGKLGVSSRTQAIARTKLLGLPDAAGMQARSLVKHNLPAEVTSFVGREAQQAEIRHLLTAADSRLVTLIGPGGVGKTRLAVHVAHDLLPSFADGVCFVALQSLSAPDLIVPAIADALRLPPAPEAEQPGRLLDYLRGKTLLLVLDNFEHVLGGADFVRDLLLAGPSVRVLATSREPLRLDVEWLRRVDGLSLPDDDADHPSESEAMRLFRERAGRVGAVVTDDDRPAIQRICRLTAGLPLALELASAWLRLLSCEEIAREIEQPADFLSGSLSEIPERHQSLRSVFEWSWGLLDDAERRLFGMLSVFRGGFSREAMHRVCGASLHTLAQLVDKSLIFSIGAGRYDIHPLLREYAREKLAASGQLQAVLDSHAACFLDGLAERVPDLMGRDQTGAFQALRRDLDNLRSACVYAAEQGQYPLLDRAFVGLTLFIEMTQEGADMLEGALSWLPSSDDDAVLIRARLRLFQGIFFKNIGEDEARQALAEAERRGDSWAIAYSLHALGFALGNVLAYADAFQAMEASLALYGELGDRYFVAKVARDYEFYSAVSGDEDSAIRLNRRAYEIWRELGNRFGVANCLIEDAAYAFNGGDGEGAEVLLREALILCRELGDRETTVYAAQFLGNVGLFRGDLAAARVCYAEAMAAARSLGAYWTQLFAFIPGFLALFDGDYSAADARFTQARAVIGWHGPGLCLVNWGQALSDFSRGDVQGAKERLSAAWRYAVETGTLAYVGLCLPLAAVLLAHEGDQNRAIEVLGYVSADARIAAGWFDRWPVGVSFLDALRESAGADRFEQLRARGAARRLDELTTEVAFYLGGQQDR